MSIKKGRHKIYFSVQSVSLSMRSLRSLSMEVRSENTFNNFDGRISFRSILVQKQITFMFINDFCSRIKYIPQQILQSDNCEQTLQSDTLSLDCEGKKVCTTSFGHNMNFDTGDLPLLSTRACIMNRPPAMCL
jgi:hypothetical protein